MSPSDRFKEAMDLTIDLDLPEDTALPAQRKRHVSLILKDVVDPFYGGMECATLATIFGVPEYTESNVFWESQETTGSVPNRNHRNGRRTGGSPFLIKSTLTPGISSLANESHPTFNNVSIQQHDSQSWTQLGKQHHTPHTPSHLDPMKKNKQLQNAVQKNNNNIPTASTSHVTTLFLLPDIPTVSKFDDWLTTSSQVLSSKARIVSPTNSSPTNHIHQPQHQQQQQLNYHHPDTEVAPPLVFFSYPPAIFDLLKSNTDDRIVLWGPDPRSISMTGATLENYSLTTLQPVSLKSGVLSNPTTATPTPSLSIRSGVSIRSSVKSTVSWINKMKHSIHRVMSSSFSSSMMGNNRKDNLMAMNRQQPRRTLQSRLAHRLSSKKRQHQQSYSTVTTNHPPLSSPMVIQAATIEKLVETLTFTLDYDFMTDFFLIYRTFISPIQLCKLLILRFQWGLQNDENDRRVVRIRTFVVIRHWLLNYFVHDFKTSRELRKAMTVFLNTLPSHPLVKHSPLDQHIVKGLKRVVRRLKKVHYPRNSRPGQVVSPAAPNCDENQVHSIVHDKDMALVENWHHGNMTSQDKSPSHPALPTHTPPPISFSTNIDNYDTPSMNSTYSQQPSSSNHLDLNGKRQRNTSQNTIVKYVAATFSKKKHQQQNPRHIKESHLHRMEQQKRITIYQQQISPNGLDHNLTQHDFQQQPGITSDVSLHSIISHGTTDDELYDELDDDGDSQIDGDLAIGDNTLEMAQQLGSDQIPFGTNMAQGNSAMANQPPRRSVYNARLSDLSPLVSPNGSVIHGPLVHGFGGSLPLRSNGYQPMNISQGQQLSTPPTSMHNILPMELSVNGIDYEKTESNIMDKHYAPNKIETPSPLSLTSSNQHQHISLVKNRISKALLVNGEDESALDGETNVHDEKALVESPTSMSIMSNESLSRKSHHGSESTIASRKLHQKPSYQQINAIRPTRAAVVQPQMMMSSTVASSIQQYSIVPQSNHRHQQHYNKPDTPQAQAHQHRHNGAEWTPNQSSIMELNIPHQHQHQYQHQYQYQHQHQHQYQHQHQHQYPDNSYLADIRASYHSPNHIESEERDHHQHQHVPELDTISQRPTDNIPASLSALFKPSMVLQHRSYSLAQHFCLVEKWILLQIHWEELVHWQWTKIGDGGGNQEDGVQQLINRFNMVYRWVSSEILRTPSLNERALVIEKFIRLAQKCYLYSNFATLIQILLGLQSPSISRLEKTWSKVGNSEMQLLKQLSSFTSPIKNWKHIRTSMTAVAEEYGMSPGEIQIQLPGDRQRSKNQAKIKLPFGGCIPFLGLYLSDLTFNSEQASYLEPNHVHHKIYQSYTTQSSHQDITPALLRQPLVNFWKHRITAKIIKQFLTFRDLASRYSFEQVDSLYSDCFYLDPLETDTLHQLSLTIEPPSSPS